MIRNYFADLELHFSAGTEDVRNAYRRLARRFHPDLNPEDLYAEESFKRIHEAYRYLSDETRAERLRKRLHSELGRGSETQAWAKTSTLPTTLKNFIRDWSEEKTSKTKTTKRTTKTRSKGRPSSVRRESLKAELVIKVKAREIEEGFTKTISYEVEKPCPRCREQNDRAQSIVETCKQCAGIGFHSIQRGAYQWKK